MTPLITRSQGAACRRAAERIAAGKWNGATMCALPDGAIDALIELEWAERSGNCFDTHDDEMMSYDQSQVLMALLWCAEIAGE